MYVPLILVSNENYSGDRPLNTAQLSPPYPSIEILAFRLNSAFALDTEDVTGAMGTSTKTDSLTSRFYIRYQDTPEYQYERSQVV